MDLKSSTPEEQVSTNWSDILNKVRSEGFSSPWRVAKKDNLFAKYMDTVISMEEEMHFENHQTQPYIRNRDDKNNAGQGVPNYSYTKRAHVPENMNKIEDVIHYLMRKMFSSMNNPHHPLFVANVLPPPSLAGLLGAIIGMKLNANVVDEHFSMNVAKAELELAAMIVHLLIDGREDSKWLGPWAPPAPDDQKHFEVAGVVEAGHGSGGIGTFGGTGCYFYAIKYALTKVANSGGPEGYDSRRDGIEQGKFVIMCSNQGHYVHTTISDWSGIGYGNAIHVATKKDNSMDHNDLIKKMNEAKSKGKVVVAVVPTFGTTDAGALEDLRAIRKIIDDFDNIEPYCKPLLYADAVIGWVWLFFVGYDFVQNPLGFREDILQQIKHNAELASGLEETDAFGTDFHKTGYTHYVSSVFMIKDYGDYASLMQRDPPPFLQQEQYDPALYTLETSRSPSGMIGAWATFKHLGKDGMRSIMYNLLDKQDYFRKKLRETGCTVICNEENHMYSTLFRIRPFHYTKDMYEQELSDESKYSTFKNINEFQKLVYLHTFRELRVNTKIDSYLTPHVSITTGFRNAYYNPDGKKLEPDGQHPMQGVFAIKCFLNSPFVDYCHVDLVVEVILDARLHVLNELLQKTNHPLYTKQKDIIYPEKPSTVHPHNNIVAAHYIPPNHFLPNDYDSTGDLNFEQLLKKIEQQATEKRSQISELRKEIFNLIPI